MKKIYDVIIVGGGLAGLINAILLSKADLSVLVIEKKKYPFHRVCGEYISNEVLPFLNSIDINPFDLGAQKISNFFLSSPSGKQKIEIPLDLGGFGISRYAFDEYLYNKALKSGAEFIIGKKVEDIRYEDENFKVFTNDEGFIESKLVIGAFGKRSHLDKNFNRAFIQSSSPYIGVKYHIKTDFPKDLIALHNFKDGYCGISGIEDEKYNMCYLTTRKNLKKYGTIDEMEENIVFKNPFLRAIKSNSEFLFNKPEVINEISFARKSTIENHILMSGDTAGLITPLCGNGMAMAIHSAKILSENIKKYYSQNLSRQQLEENYSAQWKINFNKRLWAGRNIQKLFGNTFLSEIAIGGLKHSAAAVNGLVSLTHGDIIN